MQAGYKLQPLSAFLGKPAPPAAPEIKWPKIDKKLAESDPFAYLNFLLQFCPAVGAADSGKAAAGQVRQDRHRGGQAVPARQVDGGREGGTGWASRAALRRSRASVATLGKDENGWRVATSGFGDRAVYKGDWTMRAAAAMAGIYGNDAVEAMYPLLATDSEGNKPDCSKNRYTLTFPAGQLPPANAFWSVTMYDGKTQLSIENPINRYLINSPMLPDLKKNADGSLTIYIQKDSPGKEKESNWLPAPDGPIYVVMRLYWPKERSAQRQVEAAGGRRR